ncbi:PLP-dependent aminotransferase family protein [Candidatus Sumerlaeota bacterium]|nr:PLP-dependent aminotransferase family protein [Candidatus Sumerlaeota bacterium]
MGGVNPSTIREILKVTSLPDVISFAGGLPAPELFPVDEIAESCRRVLSEAGTQALQYGTTEGFQPLREWVAAEMGRRGVASCDGDQTLVTTGSQQAIDLVGRVLLEPGDVILMENPTYLAAIQAFRGYEARFIAVPTDEDGIVPDALPELVERHRPKFLYTVPTFQNPTGITLTEARRRRLYELALELDLLVFEDDPYGALRYRGEPIPLLKSYDTEGLVIYTSTFSKIVAPGVRLGWVTASPEILAKLIVAKQAVDVHTSGFDQRVVHDYLMTGNPDSHVDRIRAAYGERYGVMHETLSETFPDGFHWTQPDGGMFLWVTCPERMDTAVLLQSAISHKVAFVPGYDFFPGKQERHFMRLNFSNSPPDKIREGIKRLAELCQEHLGT